MNGKPLTTLADLAKAELLKSTPALEAVAEHYAIGLTPAMAALVKQHAPDGPMARQFLPDAAELLVMPEEVADPIGDHRRSPLAGLVHRYPDRVLIKLVHVCPVYCRFCFRREMVGPQGDGTLSPADFAAALHYVAERPQIREVILTGGDPLILSPRRLKAVTDALSDIAHLELIRWHSRVPVVSPERVTPAFVKALKGRKAVYVAIHANHPTEFTAEAETALARLADGGIALVSQSVLLKGVNDDVATLEALMRAFLRNRVKPYYLHHPDLAKGTGHFRLSVEDGRALMRALRQRLSGLGQPIYVQDSPDGTGKVVL